MGIQTKSWLERSGVCGLDVFFLTLEMEVESAWRTCEPKVESNGANF